jgi:hypothetical protein
MMSTDGLHHPFGPLWANRDAKCAKTARDAQTVIASIGNRNGHPLTSIKSACCNPSVLPEGERSLQRGVAWAARKRRLGAIVIPRLFAPVARQPQAL